MRVRENGATVWAEPSAQAAHLGGLPARQRIAAHAVILGERVWLHVPWPPEAGTPNAWIDAAATDFARSAAYGQVAEQWMESGPVLRFRRALAQDLLRLRQAPADQVARVLTLSGDALRELEERLTRATMVPAYRDFRALAEPLGLPDPFEHLPVHILPPSALETLVFDGFGPTSVAFANGDLFYAGTRGMSPGVDFGVPEGSPLIAVADGEIVEFAFLEHPAARSLTLRPYLPERFRTPRGARVLSNVLVAYGHLTGNPTSDLVRPGDVVRAGQVIGTSGWPVYTREDGSVGVQGNNAHLHLQVHLVTDGTYRLGNQFPLNPLLFWAPRLVAFQARLAGHGQGAPYPQDRQPYGRLGFFSIAAFRTDLPGSVWLHTPTAQQVWPEGVYTPAGLLALVRDFAPYPLDGSSRV